MTDYIAPVIAGMFIGMLLLMAIQGLASRNSRLDAREDTDRLDFLEERGVSLQYAPGLLQWGCTDADNRFLGQPTATPRGAIDSVMYRQQIASAETGPTPMDATP